MLIPDGASFIDPLAGLSELAAAGAWRSTKELQVIFRQNLLGRNRVPGDAMRVQVPDSQTSPLLSLVNPQIDHSEGGAAVFCTDMPELAP